MDFKGILDKVVPTLIVALIFAIYSAYAKIGYLEYTANTSIQRYVEDRAAMKAKVGELEKKLVDLRLKVKALEVSDKYKQ
jgi:hypothetical protein